MTSEKNSSAISRYTSRAKPTISSVSESPVGLEDQEPTHGLRESGVLARKTFTAYRLTNSEIEHLRQDKSTLTDLALTAFAVTRRAR